MAIMITNKRVTPFLLTHAHVGSIVKNTGMPVKLKKEIEIHSGVKVGQP